MLLLLALLASPPDLWWCARDWRPASMAVVAHDAPPTPDEIIATARQFLGVPYSWGGTSDHGFDCSGFVNKVYAQNGYDLPRVSREQVRVGLAVSRDALQMGDLLFFARDAHGGPITHVAIYIADGEFIHAAQGHGEVTYNSLNESYFSSRWAAGRRIIALPPGRYSTRGGGAIPGVLFADGTQASTYAQMRSQDSALERLAPPPDGGPVVLQEHAPDDRPPQLARSVGAAAIGSVGPVALARDATRLQLRGGLGALDNQAYLLLLPGFSYFGPDNALRIDVAVPLLFPIGISTGMGAGFAADWQTFRDYTRVVRAVTFGQKEANVYLDLSRTPSTTLGTGQVMRYFTPAVGSRDVPEYILTANALTGTVGVAMDAWSAEASLDDVLAPTVGGAGATLRPVAFFAPTADPVWRSAAITVAWAGDWRAPLSTAGATVTRSSGVHGMEAGVQLSVLQFPGNELRLYGNGAALFQSEGAGGGAALGSVWRIVVPGSRQHTVTLRMEGRMGASTFIPAYFDVLYPLHRLQAPSAGAGPPLTKLALLQAQGGQPGHWSLYTEALYQLQRRIAVGASYEDGGTLGPETLGAVRYAPRSIMLFLKLQQLYLGDSSRTMSVYLAYHLRNITDVTPFSAEARLHEYLFATVGVDLNRYVEVAATLRKAFDPGQLQGNAWDGTLDLAVHWEI